MDQLTRIEERIDEVYDRVSELKSEMKLLKYKVAAISSAIGAIFALLIKKVAG